MATNFATRLGPRSAGWLMSPREFDAVTEYNENYHYELIHGVLVVNPIPSAKETGPNESPLLPGFVVPLGKMLELADKLAQNKEKRRI